MSDIRPGDLLYGEEPNSIVMFLGTEKAITGWKKLEFDFAILVVMRHSKWPAGKTLHTSFETAEFDKHFSYWKRF